MIDFSDLENLSDLEVTKPPRNTKTFPCESCAGTGKVSKAYSTCKVCKGKGSFTTSSFDREKARNRQAINKFETANQSLVTALRDMVSWNAFAASLIKQIDKHASLSGKQMIAAQSMVDKYAANKKKRVKSVDVSKIQAMFDVATGNGLVRPKFTAGELTISKAPKHGRNAGALYVKRSGRYSGKIVDGVFMPIYNEPKDTLALLQEVAKAPERAAMSHGKATGHCSCCNRLLTDPVSVKRGIGPICIQKWGF